MLRPMISNFIPAGAASPESQSGIPHMGFASADGLSWIALSCVELRSARHTLVLEHIRQKGGTALMICCTGRSAGLSPFEKMTIIG
jgi:hypothetical protein